ncbi:hypothetical protein [Pseudoalteromonas sp. MMG012]|uniref:hypothetical protein n=1 Tax=Pseudoalteromonas sp. MMG012 TaxID=2822686 RepID=UPI001B39D669|nr:hypothetical protein [Pseudoalteromonas sp. MMG012]MBQ4852665.1 hypothetical protein [Pseudoalteromonas sp. MMG012]
MTWVICSILLFLLSLIAGGIALFKKRKSLGICSFIGLLLSGVLMGSSAFRDFFQLDECLDLGGRYNYEANVCENG